MKEWPGPETGEMIMCLGDGHRVIMREARWLPSGIVPRGYLRSRIVPWAYLRPEMCSKRGLVAKCSRTWLIIKECEACRKSRQELSNVSDVPTRDPCGSSIVITIVVLGMPALAIDSVGSPDLLS